MTLSRHPTRCAQCRERFTPEERAKATRIHSDCIPAFVTAQAAKKERARLKKERDARKVEKAIDKNRAEKLKPRSKWEEECRAIVQKIARLRDRNDGCISCHLPATWGGQWHGSHFRSHGAATAVQFHLWNIHKSCSACNHEKGGNIIEYRPRLIEKIGQDRVDWLMAQNQIVRHDTDYYRRFKAVMGKRLRRLEKRIERQS